MAHSVRLLTPISFISTISGYPITRCTSFQIIMSLGANIRAVCNIWYWHLEVNSDVTSARKTSANNTGLMSLDDSDSAMSHLKSLYLDGVTLWRYA